jgi:hypothetical protein
MAEWIGVEDRLPDKDDCCLLYIDGKIKMGWYDHHIHNWRIYDRSPFNYILYNVTHWMPLPEPPEQEPKAITINIHIDDKRIDVEDFMDMIANAMRDLI